MDIIINDLKYKVIVDHQNGFDLDVVKEKMTDYFNDYDYVVGDWAYGKVRLKGFNKKNNKNFNKYNDYDKVDNYIKENCAYGCKYFILERIKD